MKKLIFFFLLASFLTGCAQNNQSSSIYGQEESNAGTQFISNNSEWESREQQLGETQEYTMDAQNPNFLNLDGNGVDNQDDINHARQVIQETGKYEPGPIWINGEKMWITAYKRGNLSEREIIQEQAELHRILVKALPRYDVEVQVQEDRS